MFYYSHQMLILWSVLFIIHGTKGLFEPTQAVWHIGPGLVVFLYERFRRHTAGHSSRSCKIVGAHTSDKTVVLYLEKPAFAHFKYRTPGSYAFIQIPALAKFEWCVSLANPARTGRSCRCLCIKCLVSHYRNAPRT